ncbi:MAG TPA: hypothetical protein PLP34_00185 [Chitinophagaceae bacterium]|nr:hypothetical protein [Chitinophagaceae bacterium]HNF70797.1 hypothetical protein [Chitinophagaceae bacterium]
MKGGDRQNVLYSFQWARYAAWLSFLNLSLGLLQLLLGIIRGNIPAPGATITFLISGGITFLMSFQVYRFARLGKRGLDSGEELAMNNALRHLRAYFKIMGILFIIIAGLLTLLSLITLIAFTYEYFH